MSQMKEDIWDVPKTNKRGNSELAVLIWTLDIILALLEFRSLIYFATYTFSFVHFDIEISEYNPTQYLQDFHSIICARSHSS